MVSVIGAVAATPVMASATSNTTVSSRWLLSELRPAGEHTAGYARTKFSDWIDADHDGCDTRNEVLIAEAVMRPKIRAGCVLVGGKWRSRYDRVTTTNPTGFDIDHMVPLAEAWQSGAWQWTAGTRDRYANDLGYGADLIAVTMHANRSKGERAPEEWMPARAGYACTYLTQWVAVKWRWQLTVSRAERSFLDTGLRRCGWPRLARPARAVVRTR
jgi:hypothetical protein